MSIRVGQSKVADGIRSVSDDDEAKPHDIVGCGRCLVDGERITEVRQI